MKTIKILNYAVNGLGLGHITRLIGINRWIKRIASALGNNVEIIFLTTSECDTLAYQNGFAAFKIPSKNIIKESGISPVRYRRMSKQWIWNAINLFSPDIFIVDTFPYGSFHELMDVLDFGFKKIFIYRSIKPEIAGQTKFQKSLFGYDKIIIPGEVVGNEYPVPERLKERIFHTGEIILRDLDELYPKERSRKLLGLQNEKTVCYVSAGGGGDSEIEQTLFKLTEILKEIKDIFFIIGAGPLYRGKEFRSDNIQIISKYNIIEYFNAFDFAISASGYNTTYELLYAGLPTIFFYQERMYDDQEKRINLLFEKKACLKISQIEEREIKESINILRDSAVRNAFSESAKSIISKNDAIEAAKIILSDYISNDDFEHIREYIPGSYFYELKESQISENTGLKAIFSLDFSYNNLQKQKSAIEYVSDFLDLTDELKDELKKYTSNIFTDFIEYPLNNLAIGYLRYLKNKNIDLETGIKFLGAFIQNNNSVRKSIQDILLESIKQIDLWTAQKMNIEDKMTNYILFDNKKTGLQFD